MNSGVLIFGWKGSGSVEKPVPCGPGFKGCGKVQLRVAVWEQAGLQWTARGFNIRQLIRSDLLSL